MSNRRRVMLIIPDLQDLGVQHDVRCLLKFWNHDRYEVKLMVHKRTGAFADQFPPSVASVEVDKLIPDIPKLRVLLRVLGYARAFRAFQPHAVISFVPITNLTAAWARPVSRVRFGLAVSEHAHVSASLRDREAFDNLFLSYYRRSFAKIYNRRVNLVKCIAEESRQDLINNHGIRAEKTRLIYNPVDLEEVREFSAHTVDHPWFADGEHSRVPIILNVGRLANQKRQSDLLEAFAILRRHVPARLVFVGRGPHLLRLKSRAAELGVASDVDFVGFQRNPWRFMARARLLAMSSEWEGLPCVLTEAMSLKLPIISTRCPSGPSEMLMEGRGGLLVPVGDINAMACAIKDVLESPNIARARAEVAHAHINRFSPAIVTQQYEGLADELAETGRPTDPRRATPASRQSNR